jgi:AbrB family looped-hinge helix DNA binding protein
MGDRGQVVVPAGLRERSGLHPGRKMVFIETANGVLLLTREQLREMVRSGLTGRDLVGELLVARRAESAVEDAP